MTRQTSARSFLPALIALCVLCLPPASGQSSAPQPARPLLPSVGVSRPAPPTIVNAPTRQPFPFNRQGPTSTALIILAEEAAAGKLESLTEDLNVMCRIFDRQLDLAGLSSNNDDLVRYFLLVQNHDRVGSFFSDGASLTECLFVEGYGPLFVIGVDFPLVPPPQSPTRAEPNAVSDPLWAQVSRDLYTPQGTIRPEQVVHQPAYSDEKVLSLKTTAIKALRHMVNIRALGEEGSVTIIIRGTQAVGPEVATQFHDALSFDAAPLFRQLGDRSRLTSQLVLRASMQDIRGFASGALSYSDFEKRLESAQY